MISNDFMEFVSSPELTKNEIRKKVWNYIQKNKLAKFPLPPHNRIPNFEGAATAGQTVSNLPEFLSARVVKVNPDKPQEEVRFLTLQSRKKLLVSTARLRTGLFNLLENSGNDESNTLRFKSQSQGVKELSIPINLDQNFSVDLIVIGSVAVSKSGRRIGKGEGFADLEYAMMKTVNAINEKTTIITTVHDCQVFDDLPSNLFENYDVPVDIIVTPNEVYRVNPLMPRPQCIYWKILNEDKFNKIPVLWSLRERQEKEGIDVALQDEKSNRSVAVNSLRTHHKKVTNRSLLHDRLSSQNSSLNIDSSNQKTSLHTYKTRQFTRGGMRRNVDRASNEKDHSNEDSSLSLQVTISVNKKNQIVNRSVECTREKDREASAADPQTKPRRTKNKFNPKLKSNFAVMIEDLPSNYRIGDLAKAIVHKDLNPGTIQKNDNNALVHFSSPLEEYNSTLEKLEGLSLYGMPLIVKRPGAIPKDFSKTNPYSKFEMQASTPHPPEEDSFSESTN